MIIYYNNNIRHLFTFGRITLYMYTDIDTQVGKYPELL